MCRLSGNETVQASSDRVLVLHEWEPHPYDLHAPFMSFVIGLGPFKCWQEAMMDVDCVVSMPGTEACTEYLHIPASISNAR